MPEPEDGWLLEEVEAALDQAEFLGRVMPREKFAPPEARGDEAEHIGSLL